MRGSAEVSPGRGPRSSPAPDLSVPAGEDSLQSRHGRQEEDQPSPSASTRLSSSHWNPRKARAGFAGLDRGVRRCGRHGRRTARVAASTPRAAASSGPSAIRSAASRSCWGPAHRQFEPTPFQRDLSETHHKRLAEVIAQDRPVPRPHHRRHRPREGLLDAERTPPPRGDAPHRRDAITALVVPDREVAWQILALNTEKAHNLKERSLEVIRIYRGLLDEDASRAEAGFTFYFEDPALVTLGLLYEGTRASPAARTTRPAARASRSRTRPSPRQSRRTSGTPRWCWKSRPAWARSSRS